MRTRIVALVGADGAGKSTQAERLASRLQASGHRTRRVRPVFLLFDPWKLGSSSQRGLSPRRARLHGFAGGGNAYRSKTALRALAGYLYAILCYAYLRTFLRKEEYVVCDRYFYQYFYDISGQWAATFARSFPRPDVVYWLDAPANLLRSRIEKIPNGHEPREYLDAVVRYYRAVAPDLGFVQIDASAAAGAVEETIWNNLMRRAGPFET